MNRNPRAFAWLPIFVMLWFGPAQAQSIAPLPASLSTRIDDAAGSDMRGRVAVNIAAGAGNAQSNTALLVPDGVAVVRQSQAARIQAGPGTASSHIGSDVFQNANGLLSLNMASGYGNLQGNTVAVAQAVEIETVADSMLQSTTAHRSRSDAPVVVPSHRQATVHPDAFAGANGIVQVNQAAGSGNVASNVFVLRPPAGTFF